MSRHPLDRLALVAGLPLFVIGLIGLVDDTGVVQVGSAWVWVTLLVAAGTVGIALSFASLLHGRAGPDAGPATDESEEALPRAPAPRSR